MENQQKRLRSCPLFAQIADKDLDSLLFCLSAKHSQYLKNTFIHSAGDKTKAVGIVLSGSVHVIKEDFWGNRTIIARLEEGDLFGETFASADREKIPVSVYAAENADILLVDYEKITMTCPSSCIFHSQLIRNMIKILANKNIALTQKIEHITHRTTREKLLSYFSAQALLKNSDSFDIPFNRQELADYLSVDRSAMSNELCKMRDEGILIFNRSHFELKQKDLKS